MADASAKNSISTDRLAANLGQIENSSPALALRIRDASSSDLEFSVEPARKDGELTMKSSGRKQLYLHSRYNPRREAAAIIKKAVDPDADIIIIGGLGLGYLAEEALKFSSKSSVIIVEHSPLLVRTAFQHRDFRSLLQSGRLDLLITDSMEDVTLLLDGKATRKISMVLHRPSFDLFPDFYENLRNILYSFINSKEVNMATMARFERLWTRNVMRNIPYMNAAPGIRELAGAFQDVPAFIAGAGPSLARNIHLLQDAARKGIVIAVDTVLRVLLAHGIEPHIVVAVDPQHINIQYFRGLRPERTVLVADASVAPALLHIYEGPVYLAAAPFPFARWFEQYLGSKGYLMSGGSVSTSAYDLAEIMGCNPIVLTGQDLAYSGERIHIRGTIGEEIWENTSNRVSPVSRNMSRFLNLNKTARIPAYGGRGEVWSDRKFLTFLWWFERRITKSREQRRIINATEGGARIKGSEEIPLEKLLADLPEQRLSIPLPEGPARSSATLPGHSQSKLPEKLGKRIHEFHDFLLFVHQQARHACQLGRKLLEGNSGRSNEAVFAELDRIDASLQQDADFAALLSSVLQKTIHSIREGFDEQEEDDRNSANKWSSQDEQNRSSRSPELSGIHLHQAAKDRRDTGEETAALRRTISLYTDISEAALVIDAYLRDYLLPLCPHPA